MGLLCRAVGGLPLETSKLLDLVSRSEVSAAGTSVALVTTFLTRNDTVMRNAPSRGTSNRESFATRPVHDGIKLCAGLSTLSAPAPIGQLIPRSRLAKAVPKT
jgi:hypothetical protein